LGIGNWELEIGKWIWKLEIVIAEQRSSDARQKTGRKLVVHMDNATPHRAKLTKSCFKARRICEADHPPYSPDLAPSDFYLFGKLKGQMVGSEFESTEDLLATIRGLTNAISREERETVFQEWERRLGECIRIGREYVS
jgi:transposase